VTAGQAAAAPDSSILLSEDRLAGRGRVRILTLNRPAKRNALSTALLQELQRALRLADRDPTVHAVVLAGDGVNFCAGGDVSEFRDAVNPRMDMIRRARLMGDVLSLPPRLSVPVVCAAHGAALGAGAALALAADMIVAGPDLLIGYPELQDGVVPTVVMPGAVHAFGPALAFDLLSTGRRLTAAEALQHGVVSRVVDPDELVQAALDAAERWSAVDRQLLSEMKRLFRQVVELPVDAGIHAGIDVTAATWTPSTRSPGSAR
jgi:methylglutaconyl-CoA hydratase